jgi:hypothetical protein
VQPEAELLDPYAKAVDGDIITGGQRDYPILLTHLWPLSLLG